MNRTRLQVLVQLWQDETASTSKIGDLINKDKQTVHYHIKKLEEKGYIKERGTSQKPIREVTEDGEKAVRKNIHALQDSDTYEEVTKDGEDHFIHYFEVGVELEDNKRIPDNWREVFGQYEDMNVEEIRDFDQVKVRHHNYQFRLTSRKIHVRLLDELEGSDVLTLKDRAWEKIMEGLKILERRAPFSFDWKNIEARVNTQHLGARGRNLAYAFAKHIEEETELEVSQKFRVFENDDREGGEIRLYADKSGGLEVEGGNGGRVDALRETPEDDLSLLQEHTWNLLDDPENTRRLTETPERLDKVEEDIQRIEESLSGLSGAVQKGFEEVTSVVKGNNPDGSQVQKQVMEMKSVQEDLQEELAQVNSQIQNLVQVTENSVAVQSSRSVSDEKIIEKLDKISQNVNGGKSSIVNPLAEHVEIASKWEDRWGNIRAYSPELGKQFKLIDSEDLAG